HLELIPLEAEFALWVIDGDFVIAAPAGGAIVFAGAFHAGEEPLEGEVGEAVDLEEFSHLLDGAIVGDQFLAGGEINSIKAGMSDGRAGDAQVDFLRPGSADGAHFGKGGGPADDGVFDDDDAFALDDV